MSSESVNRQYELLKMSLDFAVYIRILEIKKRGGIVDADIERIADFAETLAFRGDVLVYGSRKEGEVAEVFNGLADAIAVMSFFPGGVYLFGIPWQSEADSPALASENLSKNKQTVLEILVKLWRWRY